LCQVGRKSAQPEKCVDHKERGIFQAKFSSS
jgi:hypothetical protein